MDCLVYERSLTFLSSFIYNIYLLYHIYVQDVVLRISFYYEPSEVDLLKPPAKELLNEFQ